jgi:ribosome biogenesis SPOUT family RNA methylase Rps3
MQADKELAPEDANKFDAVVFGGILGNVYVNKDGTYGSDDKTSKVRVLGFNDNRRHLGELQMTTDTAVLVTKLVLRQGKFLHEIPFVDHPEIPADEQSNDVTQMEGFRYVTGYDGQPVLPQGMKQLLAASMDWDLDDEL